MRVIGLFASAMFVLLSALVAIIFWYARLEHEQPLSSGEEATERRMLVVAVAFLLLAAAELAGVALRDLGVAVGAFTIHLLVAAVILRYALHESQHSDGELLVFAGIVELLGLSGLFGAAPDRSVGYWRTSGR